MYKIAIRMLLGDKIKFLTLLAGIVLATLLIIQQGSIFTGVMKRFSVMVNVTESPIWVMDPNTELYDAPNALPDTNLVQVKSVDGVEWAMPYSLQRIKAKNFSGLQAFIQLIGIDEETLIGMPQKVVAGNIADLSLPDAVAIDKYQVKQLGNPKVGDSFEINDHRAIVVAIIDVPINAYSNPVVFTTYDKSLVFNPPQRKLMSFILVKPKAGVNEQDLLKRITDVTGLKAVTDEDFAWETMLWFILNTGIPVAFGFTISLGVIVGAAIAAQTFYTFTLENLRHFATLKAIGANNKTLIKMMLLQSFLVGLLGYGIGFGAATLFGSILPVITVLPYYTPYTLLIIAFLGVVGVSLFASLFSIKRVIEVEPAIVFRG